MLQYQTIEPGTLQLLKSLQSMSMFQGLRLVGGTALALMKSLTYFEDAESDPMPFMFEETDWEDAKTRIREAVRCL